MEVMRINKGDRVEWTYSHSFGISRTRITKEGEYCGLRRHTVKHWRKRYSEQMAYVLFDGNKRRSLVPFYQLKLASGVD